MSDSSGPRVSVVTSVHNGEAFLGECIDSVLQQSYPHWEYVVLDNASTDATLAIAREYARRDGRIRVHSNAAPLPVIASHNKALSLISADSKYCKIVLPDDWIFPECLEKMVGLAEAYPSTGIVGSYQLSGGRDIWYVRNLGLSYAKPVVPGADICRAQLLGTLRVFGNPTSVLYRADLVRGTDAFFPNPTEEADTSACLKWLRFADFGFVHQILTHERIHYDRLTTASLQNNSYVSAEISDCQEYGDWYLSPQEKQTRIDELLDQYYRYLSVSAFKLKNRDFWNYHVERLHDLGYRFDSVKFCKAVSAKLIDLILNPAITVKSIANRIHLHSMLKGAQTPRKS